MTGTEPITRFSRVMEVFLWLVASGVLAENIFLFLENRRLSEALAPQITAGTQLQMLAGIGFDGRLEPVTLPLAIYAYNHHLRLLSPGPMVVKQPKFTRVEEPILLCNQVPS